MAKRALYHAALALAVLAGAGTSFAPAPCAQDLPEPGDGFTWERVGDVGLDVQGLAFGPDSTLWATGTRGPYRLDTTGGFPGQWIFLSDYPVVGSLVVLGRGPQGDTLVTGTGGSTRRSVDGGLTWAVVHDRGGGGLYEVPAGYPHAGRILTGARDGLAASIAYSDDRGATFTPAVVPGSDNNHASAEDFAALPPGSPYAGRLLAAGRWGVNVSDDGGRTWRESGLWQAVYYVGEAVDAVGEPAGGAVAGGLVNGQALARAWSSADDGQTWGPGGGGHRLTEGPPNGGWGVKAVLALGGSSALVVLFLGTVYRTDDAGQTWKPVGRVPDVSASPLIYAAAAVLGPDRRLYVGLAQAGAGEGWVWRTAETHDPAPVSNEPPPASGEPLGVEVAPNPVRGTAAVALTLPEGGVVEAALYDVLGRRVAVLYEGPLAAGRHEMDIEAGLPPGVYVVRVAAGSAVAARTVTVLR